jgi:hypothetical protein
VSATTIPVPPGPSPATGRVTLVKVFTATTTKDRGILGDRIMSWLAARPGVAVRKAVVTASSDRDFHCVSITVFCEEPAPADPVR